MLYGKTNSSFSENVTVISTAESRLEYTLLAVFISTLSVVGILGNVPVLIVYFRRKDRKASNTFIKSLSLLDLVVCIFVMPYTIVYEYHIVTSDVMCRFFEFLRHFTVFASNVTLLAIAIERYVAVCHIGTKIRVRTINRCIYGIFVLAVFVAAPSAGTFAVVSSSDVADIPCRYPHEMTPGYFCHFTYTVMGQDLVTAYQVVQMALFFIELIFIVVLYTAIYVVLWRKAQIRKKLTKGPDNYVLSENVDSRRGRDSSIVSETVVTFTGKTEDKDNDNCRSCLNQESCPLKSAQDSRVDQILPLYERKDHDTNHPNDTHDDFNCEREVGKTDSFLCKTSDSQVSFESKARNNNETMSGKQNGVNSIRNMADIAKCSKNSNEKPLLEERSQAIFIVANNDKSRSRRSYHRRTAKMLFLCTVVYFVTWMPFWLDIFGVTSSLILRYMLFIGNATNPIIYGIVNKQVRRSFKRLFVDCLKNLCFIKTLTEAPDNSQFQVSFSETSL